MVYRFGPFTFDSSSFALCRNTTTVQLPPKLIDLLLYLVGRPATVVTKDELFKAIWPDVVVTDNALTQAVSDLRQALGDRSASPTYVQTVAKRGYRFIAPVEVLDPEPAPLRAHHPRETSNLDATRAFTEGRLQLESLDRSEVVAAVENFKRAIGLDPGYAAAPRVRRAVDDARGSCAVRMEAVSTRCPASVGSCTDTIRTVPAARREGEVNFSSSLGSTREEP